MVSTCFNLWPSPGSTELVAQHVKNSCLILLRIHFSVGTKTCISDVAHCPIPAPEAEVEAAEAAEAADVAEASMPAEAAEVPAAEVQLSSAQSKHGYVVAE